MIHWQFYYIKTNKTVIYILYFDTLNNDIVKSRIINIKVTNTVQRQHSYPSDIILTKLIKSINNRQQTGFMVLMDNKFV
jgi:hypothetical protein